MARTLVASGVAALAVCMAWLSLEDPRLVRDALAVVALAIGPALVRPGRARLGALVPSVLGAAWVSFGAQPWELLPLRDERVLAPALRDVGTGIVDFYDVFLPFVPLRNPEMHVLVLCAIFGFTLAASLLVAARRPIGAAAVTVAGVGWPATLGGGNAIAFGTIALSAALAIPLLLRVGSVKTLLAGAAIGALVVLGAATASSGTTLARQPAVDWQNWDLRASAREASSVRFIWDSNYDGISFPPKKTVVLRIDGPQRPYYWRSTTLDLFNQNHWFEDLFWLDQVDDESRALQLPQLVPKRVAISVSGSSSACVWRRSSTITSSLPGRRSGSTREDSASCSSSPEGFCASATRFESGRPTGSGATRPIPRREPWHLRLCTIRRRCRASSR